jgi:hypothetical protein
MDLDAIVRRTASPNVQAEVGACTDLSRFDSGSFDVVFASRACCATPALTASRSGWRC